MSDPLPRPVPDPDETTVILRSGVRCFTRYTLVRVLGEGGMGVVWLAQDEKLEREVALKFLPTRVVRDPEAIRDLKRETKRCLDLTHPNIVRVHDFVEDTVTAAIAMEFVPGRSLSALKAARPTGCFDAADLAPLVHQLCAALDYAHHQAHVVHRDLKPANLLVTDEGVLKVADFGISCSLRDTETRHSAGTRTTTGTLTFMGPQQLAGLKAQPSDDIYALGATLYDLLTGKPPFHTGDLVHQVRELSPMPLEQRRAELENTGAPIPAAWQEMIFACLAKDPAQRPASATMVAARLDSDSDATRKITVSDPDATAVVPVADPDATVVVPRSAPLPPPTSPPPPAPPQATGPVPPSAAQPPPGKRRPWWLAALLGTAALLALAATLYRAGGGAGFPFGLFAAHEFIVTVSPPKAAAHLWLGPYANVAVANGRAVLKDLPEGDQELSVQAPGFQLYTARVNVQDGRGRTDVQLRGAEAAMEITARPGTIVTAVDAAGHETHVGVVPEGGVLKSESPLSAGTYTLKFSHSDCLPAEQGGVELSAVHPAQVKAPQVPLPGVLKVVSLPAGAEIRVNGEVLGHTPATLTDQPSEQALQLEVFLRGYRREMREVNLQPKETQTVDVGALVAEAGTIELRMTGITVPLTDAQVQVDGSAVTPEAESEPGRWRIEGVGVGNRTVEIAHPDFEPWKQTVTAKDRQTASVDVALVPKPGVLTLTVNGPAEYTVLVDGAVTPPDNGRVKVPAIKDVTVEVDARGYKPAQKKITLPANGAKTLAFDLEPQTAPEAGQPWEHPELGMKFVPVTGTNVLFSVWDTRVQDYQVFANETHRSMVRPRFTQGPTHPVVNVSWTDAKAFCAWLTQRDQTAHYLQPGQSYRLPTDAEWSTAAGLPKETGATPSEKNGKIRGVYPWGTGWPPPPGAGNYADETAHNQGGVNTQYISGCTDGYADTSPVGSFAPNKQGLYDMGGNVRQWCEDYFNGRSGSHVMRGSSFGSWTQSVIQSSFRAGYMPETCSDYFGFRCVLVTGDGQAGELRASSASAGPALRTSSAVLQQTPSVPEK